MLKFCVRRRRNVCWLFSLSMTSPNIRGVLHRRRHDWLAFKPRCMLSSWCVFPFCVTITEALYSENVLIETLPVLTNTLYYTCTQIMHNINSKVINIMKILQILQEFNTHGFLTPKTEDREKSSFNVLQCSL